METLESYQIKIDGLCFAVEITADYGMGMPWEEYDGYGVIEKRRYTRGYRPEKSPNEIILYADNDTAWIYDVKATLKKAKKEAWGIENPPADWSKKQIRAEAVKRDIDYCKKWLTGDMFCVAVGVTYADNPDYVDNIGGVEASYLAGGFDDAKWHANLMAGYLADQIKKEKRETEYWASRDVCTV